VFALVLSIVGLYGVVAHSVSQWTREIGLRMALGVQPRLNFVMVLQEAGWLAVAGLFSGLLCAAGSSLLLRNLLFEVRAWDGIALFGVALLLGVASIAAAVLPARRAVLVNPVDALRARNEHRVKARLNALPERSEGLQPAPPNPDGRSGRRLRALRAAK